jgi:hypothetical protein
MRWAALLLAVNGIAASLTDLQATAEKLRAQRSDPPGGRGESPPLTEFKHQVRDWVESRMTVDTGDPQSIARELNRTLADAGLMCKAVCDDDQDELGYLAEIQLDPLAGSRGWLVLGTRVGIACGEDESVYLYERVADRWLRRFESEQNQYGEDRYNPQDDIDVQSTLESTGRRLVLTLGISSSCASNWQMGYYRLVRLGKPEPLLDGEHVIYLGNSNPEMRLAGDDVFLPFSDNVLHFKIEGDRPRRVAPIALNPAAFVDEWRTSEWAEVAEWSDPSLAPWHARVAQPLLIFGFWDDVTACSKRPGQSQITDTIEKQTYYFLVEERAPSSYRMLDVSASPHAGCAP